MPNDAVLDPIVHHLLAEDRFNRGKIRQIMNRGNSSKPRPLHHDAVSEAHDLSPPRCSPFLEAGTQDFLWLYKSRRKASVRMGGGGGSKRRNEQGNDEWKTNNTEEKIKKQRAGEKNRDYTEKERKAEESHRSALLLSSSLQKKNNKEPKTIDNRHHHCLLSFISKPEETERNQRKKQKERTQAEESHRDRCYCLRRFQNQERKQRKTERRNEALPNQCTNHPQLRLRCQTHQTR
jgi:hypothetical protein